MTMPLDLAQAIVAEATALANPSLPMGPTIKESNWPFTAGPISWHTPLQSMDLWSTSFAQRLTAAHTLLTPTLTLWGVEAKKSNTSVCLTIRPKPGFGFSHRRL
jgi:hypothetical protein